MIGSSLVEGIGNEVLLTTGGVLLTIVAAFIYFGVHSKIGRYFQASSEGRSVPARPHHNVRCPICLSNATLALETNCGHIFCGRCMIQYWHRGNFGLSAMSCAMCRQQINMLFSAFSSTEMEADDSSVLGSRRNRLLEDMHQYNRTFSGEPRTLWQMLLDSPVLVRHLLNDLLSDRGIMRMFQLRIVCCVIGGALYLLSPLDILPEALFGLLGFVDDVLVLLMLFVYMSTIYHRIMLTRANDVSWTDSDGASDGED